MNKFIPAITLITLVGPPGRNRNFLAGLRISTGTLGLLPQLEVAEAGELDTIATLERQTDFLEKALHHIFGFALVETHLLEKHVGELRLGQSDRHDASGPKLRTEIFLGVYGQNGHRSIDFRVFQSPLSFLHRHAEGKAFPVRLDTFALILARASSV